MKLIASEFQPYMDAAVADPSLTIKSSQMMFYPYVDFTTKAPSVAAAMVSRVVDGSKEHTVVLSLNVDSKKGEVISLWCSDKFVDTRLKRDEAEQRARESAEAAGLVGPQVEAMVLKLMEGYGLFDDSGACSFWAGWRGKDKKLCSHTSTVLATLRDTRPNVLQELRTLFESATNLPAAVVRGDIFSIAEMAFRIPVLIEGDRGAGKTFTARALARDGGYGYVEAPGHEGIEAADLYGFLVPVAGYDGLVWKDGPLSKAFRMAQHKKTVLVLDEMLRIPQRQLSVLLTALSPDGGMYRLPTGRIIRVVDGVGEEEVLEVPVSNLAVIATTNVGGEYAVDTLDPALAERFIIVRMDTDVGVLAVILAEMAKARGYKAEIAKNLVEFFKKMVTAKTNGMVAEIPTTRTLTRAVELAESEADVVRGVRSQILLWVARDADGHPVKQQVDSVTTVLDTVFGVKAAKKK